MMHIFDLDLTLWDCFDKHGNSIWAKQLVPPYRLESDTIFDDVGSKCILRFGVREYLQNLKSKQYKIGFASVGGIYKLPNEFQPSIQLLTLFGIYEYFSDLKSLQYKTADKTELLKYISEDVVFYDDSQNVLKNLKKYSNVTAIDSTNIMNWNKLI